MSFNILLVEDEANLAHFLELELESEGYTVSVCSDGMAGLLEARNHYPDLMILDWVLPFITGPEICRRLRTTGSRVPIILFSAKDSVKDRVTGLDSGADDYLTKPFRIEELLARVRTRLRDRLEKEILRYSGLALNQKSREVFLGSQDVRLSAKEFDLLTYFLQHPRQALPYKHILNAVWKEDDCRNYNLVQVYVSHLRVKLEKYSSKHLIHTIRGFGYILR